MQDPTIKSRIIRLTMFKVSKGMLASSEEGVVYSLAYIDLNDEERKGAEPDYWQLPF